MRWRPTVRLCPCRISWWGCSLSKSTIVNTYISVKLYVFVINWLFPAVYIFQWITRPTTLPDHRAKMLRPAFFWLITVCASVHSESWNWFTLVCCIICCVCLSVSLFLCFDGTCCKCCNTIFKTYPTPPKITPFPNTRTDVMSGTAPH